MITPACFVYGIQPDDLSYGHSLQEVIALSSAACRFLANLSGPVQKLPPADPAPEQNNGPDIAGFREIYGRYCKPQRK